MATHGPIGPETAENSVRSRVSNRGATLTRPSACQLPPEWPDIEWPVEPKPPREVPVDPLRGADVLVDVVRVPDSAVETDVGARLENTDCERLDEYDEYDEPELQPQLPRRRRRHGCSPCAAAAAPA
jgi:hypothetical protein